MFMERMSGISVGMTRMVIEIAFSSAPDVP